MDGTVVTTFTHSTSEEETYASSPPQCKTIDLEEPSNTGNDNDNDNDNDNENENENENDNENITYNENKHKPLLKKHPTLTKPNERKDDKTSKHVNMRKSTLALLGFLLVAFMVLSAYFFTEWYLDSKLNLQHRAENGCTTQKDQEPFCEFTSNDVHKLQSEIDRLEGVNTQFSEQLADYEGINNRLNASVEELKHQNEILSENNLGYEELNERLSTSVASLQEENSVLAAQVTVYTGLNQDLNVTAVKLEDQVDRLGEEVDDLTNENDRLDKLVGSLANETDHLWELSNTLQGSVDRLQEKVDDLRVENDRLEVLTDNFQTIASFLDETAEKLDDTYDDVTSFLAEQISTNRILVMESLQNTYHQRITNWDCAFRDQFSLEFFSNDGNTPIAGSDYTAVIAFVEERVLSDLCLDTDDFESYMKQRYSGQDITSNRLVASVQRYTWDGLDYYFPEVGEEGLTPDDWAASAYECDNLSSEKQFLMA